MAADTGVVLPWNACVSHACCQPLPGTGCICLVRGNFLAKKANDFGADPARNILRHCTKVCCATGCVPRPHRARSEFPCHAAYNCSISLQKPDQYPTRQHSVTTKLGARPSWNEVASKRYERGDKPNERACIHREGVNQSDCFDRPAGPFQLCINFKCGMSTMAETRQPNWAAWRSSLDVRQLTLHHVLDGLDSFAAVEN